MNEMRGFELNYIYDLIYYSTLNQIRPLFKDSGFVDEKEKRIILKEGQLEEESKLYKSIINSEDKKASKVFEGINKNVINMGNKLKVLKKYKKYNVFKDGIRGYYAVDLSEIWSDALIREVIIGPKCFQNKKELRNFLNDNDLYETKISVSKIPLR